MAPRPSPHLLRGLAIHTLAVGGVAALLGVLMLLPFLPGTHDALAAAVSSSAQLVGVVGLLVVPIGVLWLAYEVRKDRRISRNQLHINRRHAFAFAAVVAGCIVAAGMALAACAAAMISFGLLLLFLSAYSLYRLMLYARQTRKAEGASFSVVPIYLILVPVAALLLQLWLASPVTEFSRNRAIASSASLIADIEAYRARHDEYPESLLGINKDYHPSVIGIDRYEYARRGDAYNLAFEQPLFLLDELGTREWVVYNPLGEHFIMSHVAWNLEWAPREQSMQQGWFSSHDAGAPGWKCFRFD